MKLDTALADRTGEVLRILRDFVEAVNRGDQPAALAHLAPDVTIVEDVAPYCWQGPGAGAEWMYAMWQNGQRTGLTEIHMALGAAGRIELEGDRVYAVLPGLLSLSGSGGAERSDGTLTFALRRTGESWQIAAFTWSAPPPA